MSETEAIDRLRQIIRNARRMVFFGGAGVSTESGIPDFRSPSGLYRQKYRYPPETILSRSFFDRDPETFFEFYREKMLFPSAEPNTAHKKLAEWEREGLLSAVVTQNIDGLHQKAGSKRVLELHGSVLRNHCMACGRFYGLSHILETTGVPRCACGGIIKPDVVLYEEPLDYGVTEDAVSAIAAADVLIVGGTSLTVYPASSYVRCFRGDHLVIINRDRTPQDSYAELVINEPIGRVFGEC